MNLFGAICSLLERLIHFRFGLGNPCVFFSKKTIKHVDGAGKVDGSIVVALPIDKWSTSRKTVEVGRQGHDNNTNEEVVVVDNEFVGGGLTFWDGIDQRTGKRPAEIHYDTRSGDVAFIDRYVCFCFFFLFFFKMFH